VRGADDRVAARVGEHVALAVAHQPDRVAVDVRAVGIRPGLVGDDVGEDGEPVVLELAGDQGSE
jgi:hypothetical protein